jgi:SAM-dependent MidA family methyltransferase
MTSHVDFTSLIRAGEEAGLETVGLTSQTHFLDALGIGGALAAPAQAGLSLEEYYSRRRALTELLDPAGLGRIRVLIQGRGVGRPQLLGLEGA